MVKPGILAGDGCEILLPSCTNWTWRLTSTCSFIIEGSITAAISILMYFWMVDWPDEAKFLSQKERSILMTRLRGDRAEEARMEKWNTRRLISDWRIWIGYVACPSSHQPTMLILDSTLMYCAILTTTYSFNFFAPTILVEMGYGAISAQLHSFQPYACAVVFTLTICNLSDYYKHRYGFLIAGVLIGVIGYGIMLSQQHFPNLPVGAKYFALFPLVISGFIVQPLTVAWMMNNVGGRLKRALASATQIGFGSAGGLIASNIYFANDAPYFCVGFGVCLALLLLNCTLATILMFLLKRENRLRAEGKKDHLLHGTDADNLGDDHPEFRFVW